MESILDAMNAAFTTVQADTMDVISAVLPVALAIVGTFLVVRLGIKFFKSVAR